MRQRMLMAVFGVCVCVGGAALRVCAACMHGHAPEAVRSACIGCDLGPTARPACTCVAALRPFTPAQLPGDPQELAAAVGKLGLRSALLNSSTLSRKAATLVKQERPKKKRKMQLRHMTNTHLSHMLNAQQYTSID